ncbi:hypothetical protein D3C79_727690 [compost metagenome]
MLAKQAAEIIAVNKAAGLRYVLYLHIVVPEQMSGLFQPDMIQGLVKPHAARLLEQMRKVIGGNTKKLRN